MESNVTGDAEIFSVCASGYISLYRRFDEQRPRLNTTEGLKITVRGNLWRKTSMYVLSLANICNDQLVLFLHMWYLVPACLEQSFLSKDGSRGIYPSIANFGLLAGWYVMSFTLAFIALTRLFVIVLKIPNMSHTVAIGCMMIIYIVSYVMSYLAQFVFPCCQLIFHPFNFGYGYVQIEKLPNYSNAFFDFPLNNAVSGICIICYGTIIAKLVYMRKRFNIRTNQMKEAKEYTYALQFFTVTIAYILDWVSTRVNPMLFGAHLEWYSIGVYLWLFNCGTNSAVFLFRNREIRKQVFYQHQSGVKTISGFHGAPEKS